MLRPDFTVPVVEMHLQSGAAQARYAYAGKVFRVQERDADRPSEYDQVGFELLGGADAAAADAEVFALMAGALADLPLRAAVGDIGLVIAAIEGLSASARRKAALMRHIWRPARFRRLLDRFAGRVAMPEHRRALLDGAVSSDAPMIGLRSGAEIQARLAALAEDAAEAPIPEAEAASIAAILSLKASAPEALERLRAIAEDMPAIGPAVARMAARHAALGARGVDLDAVEFEGSYGRTTMEYYSGFVFGFYASTGPEAPPVATGGRYDALTRAMGGADVPAVGAVIRPALTAEVAR